MKLTDFKGVTIVAGDKVKVIELLLDFGLLENVWGVLGILDKLPYPSDLCVGVRVEVLDVHIELLSELRVGGFMTNRLELVHEKLEYYLGRIKG